MNAGTRALMVSATLAAVLAPGGCGGGSTPSLALMLETEHFVYYAQAGLPAPCPTLGDWLERDYRAFEGYLGVTRTSSRKLNYRLYADYAAASAACNGAARNCYLPDSETIVSVEPLKTHEIVHVFETLVGTRQVGPALFSEGIATMLGGVVGDARADGRLDTSLDIENLLGSADFVRRTADVGASATYSPAAGFVQFLIARYGKDTFLSLYAALDGVTAAADVTRIFAEQLAEPIPDVIAAWHAALPPPYDEVLVNTPVCGQLPTLDAGATTTIAPGCGNDAVRITVPGTGRIDLVATRQATADLPLIQLLRCDGGAPLDVGVFVTGELRVALDVVPGDYMAVVAGGAASIAVSVTPVTLDADGACTADRVAAPLGGAANASLLVVRRWKSPEARVALDLRADSDGALSVAGVSDTLAMPDDVYACPAACLADPQECAHDNLPAVQTQGEPRDVFGKRVAAGDVLHFETGPRVRPDWQYALQVGLTAPGP